MTRVGRPSTWEARIPEIVSLYEQGLTRGQIARRLETSVQTITRMLSKAGVHIESRPSPQERGPLSEDHKAKIAASRTGKKGRPKAEWRTERVCQWEPCSSPYEPDRPDQRFCSRGCGNRALAAQARLEWEASPRSLCPCGNPISFEHRNTWHYCSEECRKALAPKRQTDPANHIDLVCDNEACPREGEPFTRPRSLWRGEGAKVFCSNECAAKWTRKVRHIGIKDSDVVLDSGYEALLWGLCTLHKIPIVRYDRTEAIPFGDGWYAPDFIVSGITVEVKGLEDDDDRARYAVWREQRGPLVVLTEADLRLLLTRDRDEILDAIKILDEISGAPRVRLAGIATVTKA